MKLKFALVGLAALGSLAAAGTASAMPLAPLSSTSNVESVAVVCGPNGCIRTAPVYRRYGYGVRRYGVRRGYAYHRGHPLYLAVQCPHDANARKHDRVA